MKSNFENDVSYFVELTFSNIQLAKTSKCKIKTIFNNILINFNEESVSVFNSKDNNSYTLYKQDIESFEFNEYLTQYLALYYLDRLTKYVLNQITFEELAEIKKETPKKVSKLLKQKNNISEQLILLRKNKHIKEVQEYIDNIYNRKQVSAYVKYLIDRYYYEKKDLVRPKKSGLERKWKILLS